MTRSSNTKEGSSKIQAVLNAQREYSHIKHEHGKLGLTIPGAFIRGIRHIGYRSNIEAIAELMDNSLQAYAEHADLIFGYEGGTSSKKPRQLAILDDGHGMDAAMLRLAMAWGGTHRENNRQGLGRFGYGLPCAAVSMGRRFTILSRIQGSVLRSVTLDLDDLDAGMYTDENGDIVLPKAKRARLPSFVANHILQFYPNGWKSGTIVLIEKLDRLDWTTALGIKTNLIRNFSVAYHKLLEETQIRVDSQVIHPIDPLFLTEGNQLFALDKDRAHALHPLSFKVKLKGGGEGSITLRYAWLPPSFASNDKSRDAVGLNANARFNIIKDYHGIIFSRNGRVIDVQPRTPWTVFINNDRYIKVEVEFSASLDEMFGVTTSKQQVSVSPEMWDRLREAGLHKAIEQLRGKVRSAKTVRRNQSEGNYFGGNLPHVTRADTPKLQLLETHMKGDNSEVASIERAITTLQTEWPRLTLARLAKLSRSPRDALASLLDHIEERMGTSTDDVRSEYRMLMDEWLAQTLLFVEAKDEVEHKM
jgi:hypothetical protein